MKKKALEKALELFAEEIETKDMLISSRDEIIERYEQDIDDLSTEIDSLKHELSTNTDLLSRTEGQLREVECDYEALKVKHEMHERLCEIKVSEANE